MRFDVIVLDGAPGPLAREHPALGAAVAEALAADGIELHLGAPATAVTRRDGDTGLELPGARLAIRPTTRSAA